MIKKELASIYNLHIDLLNELPRAEIKKCSHRNMPLGIFNPTISELMDFILGSDNLNFANYKDKIIWNLENLSEYENYLRTYEQYYNFQAQYYNFQDNNISELLVAKDNLVKTDM